MAKVNARSARVLAGSSAERAVMRNEAEGNQPRRGDGTTDITRLEALEEKPVRQCPVEVSLANLERANEVRLDRAEAKRRLAHRELHFDDFLDAPPKSCLKAPVQKVLAWLPNIGQSRARELIQIIVAGHGVDDASVLVRELTARGRYMLSAIVKPYAYPNEVEGSS
jgi:hypothetical protein